jgi:hypothetical protein
MLLPLKASTTALADGAVPAELMKFKFLSVTPLALLDPMVSAAPLLEMTTWF